MTVLTVVEPGTRFGRFTIIGPTDPHVGPSGAKIRQVLARCDCGTMRRVLLSSLRTGKSKSCGCLATEMRAARQYRHGGKGTALYNNWMNMKQRSSPGYPRKAYANVGRDPRWDSFEAFRNDMGATYFPGAVLGRYGDVGDYGPTNCRWITKAENNAERLENMRRRKAA